MILKTVGMICILAATTLGGACLGVRDKYRLQDLNTIMRAMTLLQSEIAYLSAPLPEALEAVSLKIRGEIGLILEEVAKEMIERKECSAEEIWTCIWQKHITHTYFIPEDFHHILEFGKTLGYLDKQQQQNSIALLLDVLRQSKENLLLHIQKTGKLYYQMGFLCGLLVIIALL